MAKIINMMVMLAVLMMCFGCAAGALRVNPEELGSLQTTRDGRPSNGCVATNITGSSGVIGGSSRVVVTWGEMTETAINWCVGK